MAGIMSRRALLSGLAVSPLLSSAVSAYEGPGSLDLIGNDIDSLFRQ